ncbi:MAG: tetratricopeptide repeat protein [Deltaproteobacteria bacterium]|nr:tetratricopeptide repeat protein [Deltaproteobacteria bacterium]
MDDERRAKTRQWIEDEQWATARVLLEEALPSERDLDWSALMAEVEAGQGDTEGAIARYDSILQERPRNAAVLYNRALVLMDCERFEDAVSDLEDLVEVEGASLDTLSLLGEAYLSAQFLVPAWLCADKVAGLAEDDSSRWTARTLSVRAINAMGRPREASAALSVALERWTDPCDERDEALALQKRWQNAADPAD